MMSHFALGALQQATGLAYTSDGVRIDPGWAIDTAVTSFFSTAEGDA